MELLNGGDDEVVLKKPDQVRRVREACYQAIEDKIEDATALEQMKQVLEAKGELPETKVQIRTYFGFGVLSCKEWQMRPLLVVHHNII